VETLDLRLRAPVLYSTLELTGVRHADRLERRLLALALVYSWVLLWGAHVMATGQQQLVDNVRNPTTPPQGL